MEWFGVCEKRWGLFTVDVMGAWNNCKVARYFSRFWDPHTSGIDAFFINWSGECVWAFPPFSVVGGVLEHIRLCRVMGAVVLPI